MTKQKFCFINEAIEVEKQGLRLPPERNQLFTIPVELENAFQNYSGLREAFDKLTPGKKKDYCEHISSAKQEATRLARLEKCIRLIQEGLGLNDKYKKKG